MIGHWLLCLRLVEAAALGGIIGLERELAGRHAGLRTNVLICLGATFFTHVSSAMASGSSAADPARIAAQIVTGVGFLGAGTILHSRERIHGLTSAATIWVVAGIGMAVGAGFDHHAIVGTALVLLTLIVMARLERHLLGKEVMSMTAEVRSPTPAIDRVVCQTLGNRKLLRISWTAREAGAGTLAFSWKGSARDAEAVASAVETIPGVTVTSWEAEG